MSNKHKNNNYIYSILVDMCVAYGGANLLSKPDTDNSKNHWDEVSTTVDPEDNLSTGANKLFQNVQTGTMDLAAWSSSIVTEPAPVVSLEGCSTGVPIDSIQKMDEAKNNLCAALISLDHLVLLNVAFNQFPPLQNEQFQSLKKRLQKLSDEVGEKFQQEGWKLIPLNPERGICLEKIPEKHHYLFPWYEKWNDVPPESFDLLIEAMAGQPVDETLISKERLMMLQVEVENDPGFFTMLIQQVVLAREIPRAFQGMYALEAEQSAESVKHQEKVNVRKTGNQWEKHIKDFFASFAIPQFAATAAMACLVVVLVTVYKPDQQSVAPVMANFQLYGMTLHTNRGGEKKISRFEMQTGESLASDDFFQIHFSLEQDGFVSVLQQSDDGQLLLKFSGKVTAEEEVILPSYTQAFSLDKKAHVEKIYLLISGEEIDNVEAILPTLKGDWIEGINNYFPGTNVKMFMFQH